MSRLNTLLISGILVLGTAPSAWGKDAKKSEAPAQGSLHELASVWKDHKGETFTWKDLQGKTVLLSMIYTSCQATCPLIISELSALQNALPKEQQDKLAVLLFTFDPKRDTQEHLGSYAKERNLNPKWRLLRATEEDAQELAAVLGFRYKKMKTGDFAHSNIFTVLDQKGRIQHQQLELFKDREQTVKVLQDLLKTPAH
jgi:protein SCO1/2